MAWRESILVRRLSVLAALAPLAIALAAFADAACGTSAVGVDACRKIEEARCHRAPACGIDISDPLHESGTDEASCVRYYDNACLHGVEIASDPSTAETNACVSAIMNGACSVVSAPETDPACTFLIPPDVDAGTDAGTDASDDADSSDAAG